MRKIIVVPYDARWAEEFNKLKSYLLEHLTGLDIDIQHVGSTSVVGLAAKPILDVDIIVKDDSTMSKVIEKLSNMGYVHQGDLGITGREAFKYDATNSPWMLHHLYACKVGVESLENHLKLKDYLTKNPKAVEAYSNLKFELAQKYPHNIDCYVDGKTALITSFLEKAGMNSDALKRISDANKL